MVNLRRLLVVAYLCLALIKCGNDSLIGLWTFSDLQCGGESLYIVNYSSTYNIGYTKAEHVISVGDCFVMLSGIPVTKSDGVTKLQEGSPSYVSCSPPSCVTDLGYTTTRVCPGGYPLAGIAWEVESVSTSELVTTFDDCSATWFR